ncbi:hypothetical protein [Candidatus Pantoea multigeneris]|uniref:Uncharacterized protein n=1 Tax=Candidatus Pantoea multigeneris TaxID=2608357 RepID=A0ABX0RC16_9GAMM|nr:hypothetical protein [Pantoea multigeneris]NIF22093.1 hypothetical protein [Pantoea multigeneris]
MSESDFTVRSVPMLLSRNKSQEWRDIVLLRSGMLMRFLKTHNLLINVEPFDENGNVKDDLVIKKSHLTDDGLELFKKVIPGWSQYLDKGGDVNNINRLIKGLEKIRNQ